MFLRKFSFFISVVILTVAEAAASAVGVGTWNVYQSYSDYSEAEVVSRDSLCFVLASGHLSLVDLSDNTVQRFSRKDGLNGNEISHIVWNSEAQRLVIVYDDSNVDLLSIDGSILNMPDLKNKMMHDEKTVSGTCSVGRNAYLTAQFGIVVIDVVDGLFLETADRDSELGKWALTQPQKRTDFSMLPDESDGADPCYNEFYHAAFADGRLLTVRGAYNAGRGWDWNRHASVQIYDLDDQSWRLLDESFADTLSHAYIDHNLIEVDPADETHFFVGGKSGLYEFRSDTLAYHYQYYNSPLGYAAGSPNYCVITGLKYDADGNLWIANRTSSVCQLLCLRSDGTWFKTDKLGDLKYRGMRDFHIDSRGYLWMVNQDYNFQTIVCYDIKYDAIQKFEETINQNGSSLGDQWLMFNCLDIESNGRIWIGTQAGPVYIEPSQVYSGDQTLHQYIIARNDGSGLGDYMLNGLDISSVCIDRAGRKWFGTKGNGVYLISADNNTQIAHFTTDNSLLPSNVINHICIDPVTGCVYFCTESGLASYQSEITPGVSDYDKLYCYPNPVRPDFNGVLTICNLHEDSNITITDSGNHPVFRAHTFSGTMTWRPEGIDGNRLKPGVYFIYQTDADGKDGGMCKFLVL